LRAVRIAASSHIGPSAGPHPADRLSAMGFRPHLADRLSATGLRSHPL